MDFNKPIYGEVEGTVDGEAAKAYFENHGIEYTEQIEDGRYYVDDYYVFEFPKMTKEQMEEANKYTEVTFYQ